MLSVREARCLELNAIEHGTTAEAMMELAGAAVAGEVRKRFQADAGKIVILCGTGNNGGDGFVAARHLPGSKVLLAKGKDKIRSKLARRKFEEWGGEEAVYSGPNDLRGAGIIVDALLGTGSNGPLTHPYDEIVDAVNASDAPVVCVDAPTGLWSGKPVRSDLTVTFEDSKEGMEAVKGEIVVAGIGIPPEARINTGIGEFAFFPIPCNDAHKGDMGRVLVLGGGPFPGAPVLSALGALRAGADLVTILAPGSSASVASRFPELITKELPSASKIDVSSMDRIYEELAHCDVLLMGPGAGTHHDTVDALKTLAVKSSVPMVIDADGIKAMRGSLNLLEGKEGVLTPHAKEMEHLTGAPTPSDAQDRIGAVVELSKRLDVSILFKAPTDIIASKGECRLNTTGCPAMTVGGTGDVLAGVVAGLMARGARPFHAARLGAYLTGLAGERAFEKYSYGMGPMEVLEQVFFVIKDGLARIERE